MVFSRAPQKPANTAPLDLGRVDPAVWRVKADDEVYGPYTLGQMAAFIKDGRIAGDSMIARGNGAPFLPAAEIAQLAKIMHPDSAQETSNFVVVSRLTGIRKDNLLRVLNQVGRFAEVSPGTYILKSPVSLAKVRARIEVVVHTDDQVVIVDASHNRIGFIHLGPEMDVHARALWDAKSE